MSVSRICPGVFLSGLEPALRPGLLAARNITLVINCSGVEGLSYPPVDGLRVLEVPVQDRPHAPLRDYFHSVSQAIDQNLSGSTLVHCTAGRSRSPALVMAHLMRSEGLSLRQAHERVLGQRPFIRPNAGFWRQLMEDEKMLFGRNSVRMVQTSAGVLPEAAGAGEDAAYCLNL